MNKWVIGFLIGHGGALILPRLPNSFELGLIIVTIVILFKLKSKFVCGATIGVFIQVAYSIWLHQPSLLAQHINSGQVIPITGHVVSATIPLDIKLNQSFKFSIMVKNVNGIDVGTLQHTPVVAVSVFVKEQKDVDYLTSIQQGNLVSLKLKLKSVSGYENAYGFGKQRHLYASDIFTTGSAKANEIEIIDQTVTKQQWIIDSYSKIIKGRLENTGFIGAALGLLTANKSLITSNERELLNKLGLSHLMAISGLHIGIIFLLVSNVTKRFPSTLLKIALPLFLIWGFIVLIGQPPAAERAAIGISVYIFTKQILANLDVFDVFLIVVLISVLTEPHSWLMLSWWLSFYAVLGIILFSKLLMTRKMEEGLRGIISKLMLAFKFQVFITLWMAPVLILFFGGQNLASIISNLLFLPLFMLLVIPAVVVLGLVINFDHGIWVTVNEYLIYFIAIVFDESTALFKALSLDSFWLAASSTDVYKAVIIVLLLPLALVLLSALAGQFRTDKQKLFNRLRHCFDNNQGVLVSSVLAVLSLMLTKQNYKNDGVDVNPFEFYVFDVGQGSANALVSNVETLLFDLGPTYQSGFNATEGVVIPNLIGNGVLNVAEVTLSHLDADHRGLPTVISAQYPDSEFFNCSGPSSFPSYKLPQGLKIETLWPRSDHEPNTGNSSSSRNDSSCVTKITIISTGHRLLITGDITKRIERKLVDMHHRDEIDLRSEFMLSPHHGSKHSSTLPFIYAVRPDVVIHSAGVNNRFSFPHDEVKMRYSRYGVTQFSTAEHGMITINLAEPNIQNAITTQLKTSTPFWKRQNPFSIQAQIR